MIFMKIVITNCHEKLRKFSSIFFRKIQIVTDICKNPRNKKFQIPTACGLRVQNFWALNTAQYNVIYYKVLMTIMTKVIKMFLIKLPSFKDWSLLTLFLASSIWESSLLRKILKTDPGESLSDIFSNYFYKKSETLLGKVWRCMR